VLRGLHYQLPPKAQGKLIRAIQGDIFVVVVDIRKDSPTFGQWFSEVLSATNKKQFWIPMALRMDSLCFQKQRKYPTKYLLITHPNVSGVLPVIILRLGLFGLFKMHHFFPKKIRMLCLCMMQRAMIEST